MWITKAKYLNPPIHQQSLVSTIIQHYPSPLAIAVRGRGPKTTSELITVLTEFESTSSVWDQAQPNQRQNNQRTDHQPSYNQSRGNGNVPNNRGRFQNNGRRFDGSRNNQHQSPSSSDQHHIQQLNVSENENGST